MTFELRMRDNYKNGRTEGLAEGKAQAEAQIVKNFYKQGLSIEAIAKGTELSMEEVNKILSTE